MSELSCSTESVDKLLKEHPKILLLFKQEGCQPCEDYSNIVKEINNQLKDLEIAEVEIGKGEMDCEAFADKLEVIGTPTLIYYENGQKVKRWQPTGDKELDKAALLDLVKPQVTSEATIGGSESSEIGTPSLQPEG